MDNRDTVNTEGIEKPLEKREMLKEKITENGPESTEEPTEKYPLNRPECTDQESVDTMEKDSKNSRKKTNLLHVAAARTGLRVKGFLIMAVLVCVIFILLIVVISLAVSSGSSEEDNPNVCKSPSCLRAFAQVLQNANTTADPCEDFFKYACGGWIRDNQIPERRSKWGIFEDLSYRAREESIRIISTFPYPKMESVEWKVKHFYESCKMLEVIDSTGAQPLQKIIRRLGGWNVLRTFSLYSWELNPTLRTLQTEYGVNPFFKVEVVPDARDPNSGKNIIKISPSGLGLPDRSYYYRSDNEKVVVAYKNYLKDIVQLLGATGTDARQFAGDMFHFEKRIAEITPPAEQQRNPFTSYNVISVNELRSAAQSIPWMEILRAKFPDSVRSGDVEVVVISLQYLVDISNILSTTDRGALNNYVMWCFTAAYVPYMSKKYLDVLNLYKKETTGTLKPLERWEMCVEVTQKFFGFAIGAFYVRKVKIQERQQNQVVLQQMFTNIKNILGEQVSGSSWFIEILRTRALEKLHQLTLQIGYPEEMLKNDYLMHYYSPFIVQKADFFQNILYGVDFMHYIEKMKLLEASAESGWMDALNKDVISYVPTSNKIIIPEHLLRTPFFNAEYQKSLLYGSIGTHLADFMVQSINEFGLLFDSSGRLDNDKGIVNQTKELMGAQKTCLLWEMRKVELDKENILNKSVLSAVTQISGVRQAYKALARVANESPVKNQPGMESLNSAALFFLSFGQSLCSDVTIQQLDMDKTVNFHLGRKERLKSTLLQMREFSLAFHCKSGSAMYTTKQCGRVL